MSKSPAFLFYPADWRKNTALRMCSFAARAVWLEMMCIMHENQPYGTMRHNGVVIQEDKLALILGGNQQENISLIRELESNGVFRRDDGGAIYSPRMVESERNRIERAENGRKGGNPKLMANRQDNRVDNQQDNQKPTLSCTSSLPSSSASSSVVTSAEEGEKRGAATPPRSQSADAAEKPEATPSSLDSVVTYGKGIRLGSGECEKFYDHFSANGWKVGGKATMKDWQAALRNWAKRAKEFGGESEQKPYPSIAEIDRLLIEGYEQDNGPDLVYRAKEKAAKELAEKQKGASL